MHLEQERGDEVVKRCLAAEPRYGPVWQAVAKDVQHTDKTTKEILELVADALI